MGARNEGKARSNAIDRRIKKESRDHQKVHMLLLGSDPERVKIVRQMKIQHGLTDDELTDYRLTIYKNVLNSAQAFVRAIRGMGIEYADPVNYVKADHILDYHIRYDPPFTFSPKIAMAIHDVWLDPIMPQVMDRRREFDLAENAEYLFDEILRIGSADYLPNEGDILQARECLSKAVDTRFTLGALQIKIVDLGKRHPPAKWIYFFEDVNYVLFVASLGDYDQVLNGHWNLLNESITLFDSVVNSRWFRRMSVLLLLTNTVAFEDKLSHVPLARYFPDYTGGADVVKVIGYIRSRFMQVNRARLAVHIVHHQTASATNDMIANIVRKNLPENVRKDARKTPWSDIIRLSRLRSMLLSAGSRK